MLLVHFALQDANYNVVGITDDNGALLQQLSYEPYGLFSTIEDGTGATQTQSDLLIDHGFQGMIYDPEVGLYYFRGRYYRPAIGRFMQKDPNETALILVSTLLRNAQTARALAQVTANGQYTDGPNVYQFVGSNPITGRDPAGQFLFLDALASAGTRAYVRGASFLAAHTLLAKVVGVTIAATNLYAMIQYDEVAVAFATHPSLIGGAIMAEAAIASRALGLLLSGGRKLLNGAKRIPSLVRRAATWASSRLQGLYGRGKTAAKGTGKWASPKITTNRHGQLTNGKYILKDEAMAPHATGSLVGGKSQFLSSINEKELVLDAAAYADDSGLWAGNKAKVVFDSPIGVHGESGVLTSNLNLYRKNTGFVHGSPGSP